MKKSRFSESQIVAVLKEADAGVPVKDVCRKHGISNATYYQWKSKYGGTRVCHRDTVMYMIAQGSRAVLFHAN